MADVVRTLFNRLSANAIVRVFEKAGLTTPDFSDHRPLVRTREAISTLSGANDESRAIVEGIAGHITGLASHSDHVEQALRGACGHQSHLLELLEQDLSVEERILNVWFEDGEILDRARNLARAFHWLGGKFHFRFRIENPTLILVDLSVARAAIQDVVQKIEGGRKAQLDVFTYPDPTASDPSGTSKIHHIAVYLEKPASYLMEFRLGEDTATPVLHRGTKELAIDYNPATGSLDISGRGFGGARMLQDVAAEFCRTALDGADWAQVDRLEWALDAFLRDNARIFPLPDGFSEVKVAEISLRNSGRPGAKSILRGADGADAYQHMHENGFASKKMHRAYVRSIELALKSIPESHDEDERLVFVRLTYPNIRKFDGATPKERKLIDAWLDGPLLRALSEAA